ncbi:hypothetical protein HGRIS_010713 [Hohenbuehelia grisea]|uniref:Nibrin second BRCT domain-containing protein n=1 Tax=Hohenbuehelia grisea TaxID=104357 RepID=A0ABR3IXX3_9AGAR
MKLFRDGQELGLNPGASAALETNDTIAVVTDIPIKVQWLPISCYQPPSKTKSSITAEACAVLGLNLVHTLSLPASHHLVSTVSSSPAIAASLLSLSHIVKPDWLSEIIRLGNLPRSDEESSDISLEQKFVLPPLNKYRPSFSTSLPPPLKTFKVWEPNEERMNLFKGIRFLFVGEKGCEIDGETKDVVSKGGAEYEVFNVNSGQGRWHQVLTKGIRRVKDGGKAFVVVGDKTAIRAAVGDDGWTEMHGKLSSCGMDFVRRESIIEAVMYIDITQVTRASSDIELDEAETPTSPLPSFIPNTHLEEPSMPPSQTLHLPEQQAARRPTPEPSALQQDSGPDPEPEPIRRPTKRLTRRATSRQPSQDASIAELPPTPPALVVAPEETDVPRPRKALTRRARPNAPSIIGIDDASMTIDSVPDVSGPSAELAPHQPEKPPSAVAPTPRRSRLKRRVGTQADDDMFAVPILPGVPEEEPPLKKFKALFEASDPDKLGISSAEDYERFTQDFGFEGADTDTQTQTQSHAQTGDQGLGAIREEEEESQSGASMQVDTSSRGTKRRAAEASLGSPNSQTLPKKRAALEDATTVDPNHPPAGAQSRAAVRATSRPPVSQGQSSKDKPSTDSKRGAEPGKPDQDTAFLQAVASMKRGKRKEDDFDREFNQLKISKPDLQAEREEPEKEWEVLADFGDDSGVRGNFMVVVEMDVYTGEGPVRPRQQQQQLRDRGVLRPEWQNLPNFKKFKKKGVEAVQRRKVDLVVSEAGDYGMGAAYWKGGNSQHAQSRSQFPKRDETDNDAQPSEPLFEDSKSTQTLDGDDFNTQPAHLSKGKGRQVLDDDDFNEEPAVTAPRKSSRKPPSRAASTAPSQRSTRATRASKPPAKSQPLFIGDSDDDHHIKVEDDAEFGEALVGDSGGDQGADGPEPSGRSGKKTAVQKPKATKGTTRGKKAPAPRIVDDDSDDEAVFRGFKGKKRGR